MLREFVTRGLTEAAHAVDAVATGPRPTRRSPWRPRPRHPRHRLPGLGGLEVLQRLRARRSTLPVLMLTALDTLEDQVRGLDLGAEDYLVKPFAFAELLARIRVLLRRSKGGAALAARPGKVGPRKSPRCQTPAKRSI